MRHVSMPLLLACMLTFAPPILAEETQSEPAPAVTQETTPTAPQQEKKHPVKKGSGVRSKDLDLRHCLELKDNAAIAQCAGE